MAHEITSFVAITCIANALRPHNKSMPKGAEIYAFPLEPNVLRC